MSNDSNHVHLAQVGAAAGGPGSSRESHLRSTLGGRTHARDPVGAAALDTSRARELRRRSLEDELSSTRATLRATHEELQAKKEALQAAELELQRLTEGLHTAEEELRVGVIRREQFLAMLSHELRNPLAAVLHATAILRFEAVPEEPSGRDAQDTSARRVVERQTRHLARLLDDLLDMARLTSGKLELRERACDLRDAISGGLEALAPMLAERSLELSSELPSDALPMRGDPVRLQQVMEGILSNAVRYSDPGGRIELVARREHEHVRVSLRDHGRGIAPELLPRIFEPFVQSEQPLDRPLGGLGLGLTLVRHIVELHGGSVWAKSEGLGRGCELSVRLPLAPLGLPVIEERVPVPVRPCRIVLVEDQPDAREMMRLLLTMRGHQVIEAEDGGAGVDAIERVRPDVALVDIGLPTMSGYDVARRIRGNRALDSVTLVAVTGYGTHADVEAARNAGFDEHLTKPADTGRLESILARCSPLQH